MINGNALYGDEILVAALAQVTPKSTFQLKNETLVTQIFYELSKHKEYKRLFVNYPFDTDGIVPYSAAISEGMDALQQSRLLGRQNPDLIVYRISPAIQDRYNKYIKPKIAEDEPAIKKLGDSLSKELKIQEPND